MTVYIPGEMYGSFYTLRINISVFDPTKPCKNYTMHLAKHIGVSTRF